MRFCWETYHNSSEQNKFDIVYNPWFFILFLFIYLFIYLFIIFYFFYQELSLFELEVQALLTKVPPPPPKKKKKKKKKREVVYMTFSGFQLQTFFYMSSLLYLVKEIWWYQRKHTLTDVRNS